MDVTDQRGHFNADRAFLPVFQICEPAKMSPIEVTLPGCIVECSKDAHFAVAGQR
jgi:hypothetical protein